MRVTAEKFHRHCSRYLRMIRSGKAREITVTWHGSPGVRMEAMFPVLAMQEPLETSGVGRSRGLDEKAPRRPKKN